MEQPRFEIHNEMIEKLLLELGHKFKENMPRGFGFTLMLFSYEGPEMFYLSSATRDTMITAMKEFIAKQEDSSSKS